MPYADIKNDILLSIVSTEGKIAENQKNLFGEALLGCVSITNYTLISNRFYCMMKDMDNNTKLIMLRIWTNLCIRTSVTQVNQMFNDLTYVLGENVENNSILLENGNNLVSIAPSAKAPIYDNWMKMYMITNAYIDIKDIN